MCISCVAFSVTVETLARPLSDTGLASSCAQLQASPAIAVSITVGVALLCILALATLILVRRSSALLPPQRKHAIILASHRAEGAHAFSTLGVSPTPVEQTARIPLPNRSAKARGREILSAATPPPFKSLSLLRPLQPDRKTLRLLRHLKQQLRRRSIRRSVALQSLTTQIFDARPGSTRNPSKSVLYLHRPCCIHSHHRLSLYARLASIGAFCIGSALCDFLSLCKSSKKAVSSYIISVSTSSGRFTRRTAYL